MPIPNESVNESGSQTGDETNLQSPGTEGNEGQQEQRENSIPHSRVEEMYGKRLEKARSEWEAQHLEPLRKQQQEMQDRMVQAELARLEKMGWYQPEQPKPMTRDEFNKELNSRLEAQDKKFQEAQLHAYHSQRINHGWSQAASKYPTLAKSKFFQNSILAEYAENPTRDFMEIADEVAKWVNGRQSIERLAEQGERNQPHRRVMPSGRGAGSGNEGSEGKGKKLGVKDQIQARLKARNNGE
jgi:hypothetical protein